MPQSYSAVNKTYNKKRIIHHAASRHKGHPLVAGMWVQANWKAK